MTTPKRRSLLSFIFTCLTIIILIKYINLIIACSIYHLDMFAEVNLSKDETKTDIKFNRNCQRFPGKVYEQYFDRKYLL